MINLFFKYKFYLGFFDAVRIFLQMKVFKRQLKVNFLKHPFFLDFKNFADNQTFNQVILKRSYMGIGIQDVRTIVDCGANIGLTSLTFLAEYPDSKLILLEPEKKNCNFIRKNILPYIQDGRHIKLYESALYSKTTTLHLYDPHTGSHGYQVYEEMQENPNLRYIDTISAINIEELMLENNIQMIDILKIDIEGAEYDLFAGNTGWLSKIRVLVLETHDRFRENSTKMVFEALSPYEYLVKVVGDNLVIKFQQSIG